MKIMIWRDRIIGYFAAKPKALRHIEKRPESKMRILRTRGIVFLSLGLLLLLQSLLKKNTAVSEFITRTLSGLLVSAAGRLTSWLSPFSVFECLVLIGILFGVTLFIQWIRYLFHVKKNWFPLIKSVSAVAVAILIGLNYYAVTAGYAYARKSLDVPLSQTVYYMRENFAGENTVSVDDIADYFYRDYLLLSEQFEKEPPPYDLNGLIKALQKEYRRLDHNPYFFKFTPKVKTIKNSWFLTSSDIGGIAFLPTGEANINTHSSSVSLSYLAHTAAHELAHTRGVMRENEANLLGYYILLTSDDPYLRYTGYFNCFSQLRAGVKLAYGSETNIAANYPEPKGATAERERIREYWKTYTGPFDWLDTFFSNAAEFFNNLYLKSNGVENGTDSYNEFPSDIIETPQINPDTGEITMVPTPVYNNIHKVFFAIYEEKHILE